MKLLLVLFVVLAAVQAQNVQVRDNLINPQYPGKSAPVLINGAIIGGSAAAQNQFPYMVAVLQDNAWFCGGTLITAKHVLTAAHCAFNITNFVLYFGSINWRNTTTRIAVSTTTKIVHAGYNRTSLANDIAVVIMANNLAASYFTSTPPRVALVRLPKVSDASTTYVGKLATAVGWGKVNNTSSVSDTLNYVTGLTILSNTQCASYFGSTVQSFTICSYGNTTKNICSGDSGGPLMVTETDGLYTQVGVTSFGANATCYTYPSGFSRVTYFLPWLNTTVGSQLVLRP